MPATYSQQIHVRFADLDAYGHVNNATYLSYLEAARTNLLIDQFTESIDSGLAFIVVKVSCDYKKQIGLADKVIVDMQFVKIGPTRFEVNYSLHNDEGLIYATATTLMAAFDRKRQRPVRIPALMESFFSEE